MQEFMNALSLVNQLVTEIKSKIAKEDMREETNTTNNVAISDRETVVSEKESDLNQRETRVQSIESVEQLRTDALKAKRETEELMAQLEEQKEKDRIVNENAKAVNLAEKKRLEVADVKHLDDMELLKKGWDQLRTKEKTYKDRMREIVNEKLR